MEEVQKKHFIISTILIEVVLIILSIVFSIVFLINCDDGHYWIAHTIFAIFLIACVIHDLYDFLKIKKQSNLMGWHKKNDSKWRFAELNVVFSKMDLYTDFCFVALASVSENTGMFVPSLFFIVLSTLFKLAAIGYGGYIVLKNKISLYELYKVITWNELGSTSFVISRITNFLNEIKTKMEYKQQLIVAIIKFLVEDLPEMIIQILYMTGDYCGNGEGASVFIIFSIIVGGVVSLLGSISLYFKFIRAPPPKLESRELENYKEEYESFKNKMEYFKTHPKVYLKSPKLKDLQFMKSQIQTEPSVITFIHIDGELQDDLLSILTSSLIHPHSKIQFIMLCRNNINPSNVSLLNPILQKSSTLVSFVLWENPLCNKGVEILSCVLNQNNSLESLTLNKTQLGDEGVKKLAKSCQTHMKLNQIELCNNLITNDGVNHLTILITLNKKITTLRLNWNKIGELGGMKLMDAVILNPNFKELSLVGNPIELSSQEKLKLVLSQSISYSSQDQILLDF